MTDLNYLVEVENGHLLPTCALLSDGVEGVPANTSVGTGLHRTARGMGSCECEYRGNSIQHFWMHQQLFLPRTWNPSH